ncbi:hypothetical protein BC939DRAFT_472366 [Gamsiella multidivaricata]|uniref:uncharacterized protein n=1 Tax=Gamsiella multidivaricata TaxID=101098 RepID=UPI00221FFD09|nr:uncharacterized protein BC939DRAFT_472366 [Gamsiella multidivaricata]KAI7832786.1 hypothetical protein BC939DRAFT_472366 [Gamsiella multidivaricata]
MTKLNHDQQFRAQSTSNIVAIPSLPDIKSGDRFVLWKHIQKIFKNADYIANGSGLVPFMIGDDYEDLVPQRVLYHPGVVLDVEMKDVDQEAITSLKATSCSSTTAIVPDASSSSGSSLVVQITDLTIATEKASRRSIIAQSAEQAAIAQQNTQEYLRLYTSYIEANVSGQSIQAASIKSAMQERFGLWDPQVLQQALDRQAVLQSQVRRFASRHTSSTSTQYLDCLSFYRNQSGAETSSSNHSQSSSGCSSCASAIHLAKHEGYDIDQPNDFFERYGSHVLTVMKLLKHGCTIVGRAVPPLACLNLAEGVETIRRSVEVGVYGIETLVGNAIKYIEDLQDRSGGLHTSPGTMDLNAIEALEGADLRQLESFLRASDKGRDLGNLFQVVTPKGHIKWVCSDHFRDSYREFTKQQFKDIVEANRGSYAIERDYVDITLETNIVAQQFYEALIKARGVRSLTVTMNWDVSLDDLRMFEAAIRKTNVVDLIIRGLRNRKSLVDIFNRGRQYDPLLQCMANGKIQQIKIYADDNFYQHTNSSSFTTAPQLRTLSIFSAAAPPGKQLPGSVLFGNLKRCPSLLELDITTDDIHNTFEDLRSKASQCLSLKKLVLYKGFFTILTAEFCYGVIRTAELRTGYLEDISSNERSIFREGYLTGLSVRGIRTEDDEVQLMDIMRRNPKLSTITTECALKRMCAILDAFTDTRKAILAEGGSSVIRRVNLKWAD